MNEALRKTIGSTLSNVRKYAYSNKALMVEIQQQIHGIFSNLPEALTIMGWTQDAIRSQIKDWATIYVHAKAVKDLNEIPEVKKTINQLLVSIQKTLEN